MSQQRLTGSRIREQRLDRGLRQAFVAEKVGISASYLNLIEHNRRRIGGKLLADLAKVLGVDAGILADGADSDLLVQLRHAASAHADEVEVARAEEFATRYPGWASLIAGQMQRTRRLEERLHVLSERLSHDPKLADYLHEVISVVTSIRSSSSILAGSENLDADWQRRFHENIDADSRRLADSSEALIAYLDTPQKDASAVLTPIDEVETYLASCGFHLAFLENGRASRLTERPKLSAAALEIFTSYCEMYSRDALLMPLEPFSEAARSLSFDPFALAKKFAVEISAVFRRLASIPTDKTHGPFGLVVCDASGALVMQKKVPEFELPRRGGSCPLWPIYGAFARPAQPISAVVELAGTIPARFTCYAVADVAPATSANEPPVLKSTMLVAPERGDTSTPILSAGLSCRICSRQGCDSRREPAIAGVIS